MSHYRNECTLYIVCVCVCVEKLHATTYIPMQNVGVEVDGAWRFF